MKNNEQVDNLLKQIDDIRDQYIQMIRSAVERQGNIIGTFYKNKGTHFHVGKDAEGYGVSPIVVIYDSDFLAYNIYEVYTVYELFIDDKGRLICVLDGEEGVYFERPIECVRVEGLAEIALWLVEYGFIETKEK